MENTTNSQEQRLLKAKERVEELRSFYSHLTVFILVNLGLAGLNYLTNGWRHIWFIYPLLGWGIGLTIHGLTTFLRNPFFGKDWEERKIKELMDQNN